MCDSIYFTLDPRKVGALRNELRARKSAGLPGRWLSAVALYRKTGIRAEGAIATSGNAQVNPLRACHGFIDAARKCGAKVFERSPARRITTSKAGVEIETRRGVIAARAVVIATGYATPDLLGRVGRFRMKDTYVLATRRLPARVRHRMMRQPVMAWDTERPYHYVRWSGDGRLLVGGEDTRHRDVKGSRRRLALARRRLTEYSARLYPWLEEDADYAWEGLFAETPDGLPYIGRHSRYPRHLFALGLRWKRDDRVVSGGGAFARLVSAAGSRHERADGRQFVCLSPPAKVI